MTNPTADQRTPKRRSRRRRWTARLCLLFVALLVAVGLCEVALRVTGLAYPNPRHIYRDKLGKVRPNATYNLRTTEATRRVQCNGWGFHDVDHPLESTGHRFLLLGDSFLEAAQVPIEQGLTAVLRDEFRAADLPADLINAGVSGTGVAYQYALWDLFFRDRIQHDHIVVVLFLGNELGDNHPDIGNAPGPGSVTLDAQGALRFHPDKPSWPRALARSLARKLATAHLVQKWLHRGRRRQQGDGARPGAAQTDGEDPKPWDEAVRGTLARVRLWAAEARQEDKAFSIFVFNDGRSYLGDQSERPAVVRLAQGLEALAAKAGFAHLSFDIGSRAPAELFLSAGKTLGHFSPAGHRVAAAQLFPFLRDQLPK